MKASGKRTCSIFPERILSYAKIMKASGKRTCSIFPERILSYAKVCSFGGKKAFFYLIFLSGTKKI